MGQKHIIWSNLDLSLSDWREGLLEEAAETGDELDPEDESALYDRMVERNWDYLEDERMNLSLSLDTPIVAIADLGLWHGRRMGYKLIQSGRISDCLDMGSCDYAEFFVDEIGDLCAKLCHHDGTNYVRYRAVRSGVSDDKLDAFLEAIYDGKAEESDIRAVTRRLGPDVCQVYGWKCGRCKAVS